MDMRNRNYPEFFKEKPTGCFVKSTTGFCMVFIALFSIALVALVVYFATGNNNFICNCQNQDVVTDSVGKCPLHASTTKTTQTPCPLCTSSSTHPSNNTAQTYMYIQNVTSPSYTQDSSTTQPVLTNIRLPRNLIPVHYNLTLRPNIFTGNPANFSSTGHVRISFSCQNETDLITLHAYDLIVDESTIAISSIGGSEYPKLKGISEDKRRQFLHIYLNSILTKGEFYILQMHFTSPLTKSLVGMYYSTYRRNGNEVYIAVSHFHPTNARRAFPCFDESSMKATFTVTIERKPEKGYISLSNTQLMYTISSTDGFVADTFNTTERMSTYLLSFIVCDYTFTENKSRNGIMMRTHTKQERVQSANFSVQIGSELMDMFENYIEIPYTLQKYDMVTVDDFGQGAMENWGLVMFKPVYLLYDPDLVSAAQQNLVAQIISHEISHMWFGNMVTPAWWDGIWLSEGIATFMQTLGLNLVRPEWRMIDKFGVTFMHPVMILDSQPFTRAVHKEAETTEEILGLFDIIAYFKSACVLRMLWHFISPETFRQGLKLYILEHMYGSATHEDLWRNLQKVAEDTGNIFDIADIMDTWIKQKHYPLVTLTRSNDTIYAHQEPYRDMKDTENIKFRWTIPLTYTTQENPNFQQNWNNIGWMGNSSEEFNISPGHGWIIGNVQQYGYYRVNYDVINWRQLLDQLKYNHTVIHTSNRAQLIDDVWTFAGSKLVNISLALSIFDYLKSEVDYAPWTAALCRIRKIEKYIKSKPEEQMFRKMVQINLKKVFTNTGLVPADGESVDNRLLRSSISALSCEYDLSECVTEALQEYRQWKDSPNAYILIPDVKHTVMCTAIRHGDVQDWEWVFSRYNNGTETDQEVIVKALACSNEPWLLNRYLEYSMDSSVIKAQHTAVVIGTVSQSKIGKYLAWNFINVHWESLTKILDQGSLRNIISMATTAFTTKFELAQIESLKSVHSTNVPSLTAFDSAISEVYANIKWIEDNYYDVWAWLRTY